MRLEDLVYDSLDPHLRIQEKILRSRVFTRILGHIIIKAIPVRPCDVSRELEMNRWLVNRELILMSNLGLLTKKGKEGREIYYYPNGNVKDYKDACIQSLEKFRK